EEQTACAILSCREFRRVVFGSKVVWIDAGLGQKGVGVGAPIGPLHVQEAYGRAEADAFLLKTRFDRDYLEDETRRVPIELWHNALVAFASRFGRSEIPRTLGSIVHPENLGVWTRVLRGAGSPRLAFRQLDQHGGDDVLTERWITSAEGPSRWRAQVPIASPEYERDGLCALARASELAALPMLFGLSPGEARLVSASGAG